MTSKERILAALNREQPDVIPTFEWFIDSTVGQTLTGSSDPIDIVESLDIDGINVRPDYARKEIQDRTFQDEWGIVRQDTGDCIAAVIKSPVSDLSQHTAYTFPDPKAPERLTSLERAVLRVGSGRAVIFNLRDGFSDMRDILGYENALMGTMVEPEVFGEFLERSVDYNLALAERAVREFGIEIVSTTDDVATHLGMLIRPEIYFDVIGPSFKRVIQGYKDLGLMVIKHCDGDCSAVIDFWIEAGIDCLDPIDPGAGFDMADFKGRYGDRICLKGNVDCKGALQYGTAAEVKAEVQTCIDKGSAGGGLILSSSNTIHSGVKPENYRAMLAALKQYGRAAC